MVVEPRTWTKSHIGMRPAYPSDGPDLAKLASQAGYHFTSDEAVRRLQALPATDVVFLGTKGAGTVIGCVHVSVVRGLFAPPFAEVAAVVVGQGWQGVGIGRLLMDHAEAWAVQQRMSRIDIRQDIVTDKALGFFKAIGYEESEVGHVLHKSFRLNGR